MREEPVAGLPPRLVTGHLLSSSLFCLPFIPICFQTLLSYDTGLFRLGPMLCCLVTQLCPTLCDPMDCSPTGSSVRGIFQTRILEWVAISFPIQGLNLSPALASGFFSTESPAEPRTYARDLEITTIKTHLQI